MKFFKCKKGITWFSYKGKPRKFATNQVVKVEEVAEAQLFSILSSHPNFDFHEVEPILKPMVPRVEQLLNIPEATTYMPREAVIREIASYGVNPDIYSLDDVLSQQLNTLRIMTKKSFITVVDKSGRSVYVQNLKEFIEDFKNDVSTKEEKEDNGIKTYTEKLKKEKAKKLIPIVKDIDYDQKKATEKGATVMVIQKDSDELEGGKSFNEFVKDNTEEEKELDPLTMRSALNHNQVIQDETVTEELKYAEEDLKIDNFRYLVDIDKDSILASEFTEEEKENIRTVEWKNLPHNVLDAYFISKGMNVVEYNESFDDQYAIRFDKLKYVREIAVKESQTKGDLPFIELNVLLKRNKEIVTLEPDNFKKLKITTLKQYMTKLRKYTNKFERHINNKWTHNELVKVLKTGYEMAKLGIRVPASSIHPDLIKAMVDIGYIRQPKEIINIKNNTKKVTEKFEVIKDVIEDNSEKVTK
jgi:hypothetical protein